MEMKEAYLKRFTTTARIQSAVAGKVQCAFAQNAAQAEPEATPCIENDSVPIPFRLMIDKVVRVQNMNAHTIYMTFLLKMMVC